MNEFILGVTVSERDLGVTIDRTLKPTNQCKKAAAKARVVLSQITKNFHYRDRKHFINLYKQYVRPHLEFASPAWAPWSVIDREVLEKVQEQALRFTTGLKGKTYEERCKEVGLETLERRRKNQDLLQAFKIVKGIDRVDPGKLFTRVSHTARTRNAADTMNLQKERARKDVRMNSFSIRIVDHWNSIPEKVKASERAEAFKSYLKRN